MQDSVALETWKQAMPGYTVKGFSFALKDEPVVSKEMWAHYRSGYGWNDGDALHCRTRAVWDAKMLYMTVKRIEAEVDVKDKKIVYATIIDYSKAGPGSAQCTLFWRVSGQMDWKSIPLKESDNPEHFFAEIPFHESGATVEYYVSASSQSGRTETQPRTAPNGFYRFKIK
jgi:agmatine deiminase